MIIIISSSSSDICCVLEEAMETFIAKQKMCKKEMRTQKKKWTDKTEKNKMIVTFLYYKEFYNIILYRQ